MTLENVDKLILTKVKALFDLTKRIEDNNYYDLQLDAVIEHDIETIYQELRSHLEFLRHVYV